MIKNGTWKGEPASEESWEVDWSMEEPDPEYIDREAYSTMFGNNDWETYLYYKHSKESR